ncbi:MAG: nitroreductase family deazaflavin-dependent oxidoreductase [Actinomycetota bacterium]|nr:nitroreductase family deazaflavin-dependent oxidoreductase [Actinomycetota bacterium]MDQ6946115.1 nitroreductase family deazaflavin-dependent oxidoreductase [Actinomycetota bacterium]
MADGEDWNSGIIKEFRAQGGKVGGQFEGAPMLLLTTTGAKSGKRRTVPLMYLPHGDRVVVFASKAGAATNPDWYHNLVAHPMATVEIGTRVFDTTATVETDEVRDQLFAQQAELYPGFAEYQRMTKRKIPAISFPLGSHGSR